MTNQRLSKRRIDAALDAADMCRKKGQRFRNMVERMGLKAAYEAAVREAFDGEIPARVKYPFCAVDIRIPLESFLVEAGGEGNEWGYVYVEPAYSADEFLASYPFEFIRNKVLDLAERQRERAKAA